MFIESATDWPELHFKCNVDFCNYTNEPPPKRGHHRCGYCKIGYYYVSKEDADKIVEKTEAQNALKTSTRRDKRCADISRTQNKQTSYNLRDQERHLIVKERARLERELEEAERKRDLAAREAEIRKRELYSMYTRSAETKTKSSNGSHRSKSTTNAAARPERQYHTLPNPPAGRSKNQASHTHYYYTLPSRAYNYEEGTGYVARGYAY
ncbi:hypothetical protein VKT23_006736 [Stygiomarasmius scandens]|uniref:Uncharacterized protein n=1 Tax=Marasmiellus scandens TaxID=2682957 RepID=A0ABR1IS93_9AGAR